MLSLSERINAFEKLGQILLEIGNSGSEEVFDNDKVNQLNKLVSEAYYYNGWFVESNVRFMLKSIGQSLNLHNINQWLGQYSLSIQEVKKPKVVGIVMAGNVPLVGFHDFMSVLLSGNKVFAKLSSDDDKLLPLVTEILIDLNSGFEEMINFTSDRLIGIDAIIATGSNNSSRYFDYYFGKYPNIIRKNRNSIAILTGNETDEDLNRLSDDIFMYYGLGCRNVSHLAVPKGYDFHKLLSVLSRDTEVVKNHKYFNNYEYNKAIYLVNSTPHFDTGNLLLTETNNYSTPVSVVSYEFYNTIPEIQTIIEQNKKQIQCVVSISDEFKDAVLPGNSQNPNLWDYADGINTIEFLISLENMKNN